MNQNMLLFIQIQTLPPSMHHKWKEIIETLEYATDKCEDVANVIETVTLTNA